MSMSKEDVAVRVKIRVKFDATDLGTFALVSTRFETGRPETYKPISYCVHLT